MEKRSWITPAFSEADLGGMVACRVSFDALHVVQFLATHQHIQVMPQGLRHTAPALKEHAKMITALGGELDAAIYRALASGLLGGIPGNASYIFLHGAYELPDSQKLCLLISEQQRRGILGSDCLSALKKAAEIWQAYEERYKSWEEERAAEKRQIESSPQSVREIMGKTQPIYGKRAPNTPVARELKGCFPPALWVESRKRAPETALRKALEASAIQPAGDGNYNLFRLRSDQDKSVALVTWTPRGPLPTVSELKAAAERAVPRAFARPRLAGVTPPDRSGTLQPTAPETGALDHDSLRNQLEDLQIELPRDELEERGRRAKSVVKADGFEAVGWYQSFHSYDDSSWGIYLHADRLLDLACGFASDLGHLSYRPLHLGVHVSLGLVLRHELFHARAEACSTYVELQVLRGRYRNYHEGVYKTFQLSDACLEEALANYVAFEWLRGQGEHFGGVHGLLKDDQGFQQVLEIVASWLDFSPKGYAAWRQGRDLLTWRTLARQIATGNPAGEVKGRPLPLEGSLQGPLPFELLDRYIPTWVVGRSLLADAFFSAPSRAEAQRVLRHFGYQHIPARGKGSHEFWQGTDGRGFPLPRRDPVSVGVFRSLLHHFGLTKHEYLNSIRPQL